MCREAEESPLPDVQTRGIASVQLLITHYSDQEQPGISDKQKFLQLHVLG